MVAFISTPWVWYIQLKHRLFGLMPLQGLVNKYHNEPTEKNHDPLWTYWLFLTYEGVVTDAIQKAREKVWNDAFFARATPAEINAVATAFNKTATENKNDVRWDTISLEEKVNLLQKSFKADRLAAIVAIPNIEADKAEQTAYLAISNALRNPNNPAKHTIEWRVFLHMLGLAVVSLLMVGIAASNTISLGGFLAANNLSFGAYTNIATGFIFTASVWAQWMIFRLRITTMLKTIGGYDFFETRKLVLDPANHFALDHKKEGMESDVTKDIKEDEVKEEEIKEEEIEGYWSRRIRTFLYAACTVACAFTWGVVVYTKLSTGFDASSGGFIGMSGALAANWGLVFGTLAGFAAGFLWLTTLHKTMKEEAVEAKANKILKESNDEKKKAAQRKILADLKKPEHSWVLNLLIASVIYALFTSMLGQSAIVFETMGWENNNHNPFDPRHPKGLAYFGIYLSAVFLGRARFTVDNMVTLYHNVIATFKATTIGKVSKELEVYRSHYIMGSVISLSMLAFFVASLQYDTLSKPMTAGSNGHRILSPIGIAALGAMLVWTLFLVVKRYCDGAPDDADKIEAERERKTAWFPSGIVSGKEGRTMNQLGATLVNAAAYAALSGDGAQKTVAEIDSCTGQVHEVAVQIGTGAAGAAVVTSTGLSASTTSATVKYKPSPE